MQEAATMAENAQLLMNVSEFDDISKATDTLISAMQAFNYSADETLHVVDVFNTIGNNYAISTADLADSLTRSSAALVAAGNSLEQASALTVAGNTILQDPESVGNALKVVSMRIRGVSSDLEKAGEETDGMITNTAKLQAKIQGLTGVNILQDNGAFKDTYTILYELGKAYENLDDLSRASLLELIAGKTRGSAVAAILQNYELLEEAYNDALDAEGSAWKENQKYLDSIQGKIDQFTNAVQTMWNNTLDDSWIKGFVSFGTIIIQTIDKIGLLTTALIALGAVSMIKNKTGPIVFLQDLTKFATDANAKIANFPKTINTLVQGTQRLTSATLEQAVANGSLTTSEAIRQATMSGLVLSQVSLTAEEAKALLATTALNEVEQQNIITKLGLSSSSQKVTLAMLQQAVATGKLTASEATQMALATGLVAKETALTAARATKILTTNGVAASETQAIVSALGLGKATQTLTLATIQQAIANGTLTASQGAVAMSLLATQGAATGLIGTLTALLAAIWPLLAIGVAIFAIVKIIDAVVTTTKELEEELSGLKSELSDIQSELDSVNNELKTMKERMDELLSKGTLSFTEEEELKKLKKTNDELEREKYLLEQREKRKNKEVAQKFVETMDSAHGGTLFRDAVILEHSMPAWASTTEKINKKKDELKNASTEKRKFLFLELDSEADKIQKEIDNLEKERDAYAKSTDDTIDKYLEYAEGVEYFEGDNLEEWQKASNEQLDFINNMRDKWEIMLGSTNAKPNAISRIFNKEQFSEISDEIDKLVEKLKEDPGNTVYEEKIRDIICSNEELQNNLKQTGLTVDDAVASFTKFSSGFDSDSIDGITEQYQNAIDVLRRITIDRLEIEKELKQYAYGGTVDLLNRPLVDASELSKVGWENAGEGTATVFSSTYSNETGTIAVNFTPILPDGSRVLGPDELQRYAEDVISGVRRDDLNLQIGATFEGEDAIDQAVNAAEKIHNLQDMYYLPIKVELDDGTTEEIKWDDLFEWDEASKQWKAQSTQFAKILKDTDETLRQEFITLAENIKNNKISIEDAVNSLELSGLIRITKLTENTLSTLNTDMFADVKDDISGLIDTFSELGSALESTASAMDLLHSAQQQMNNSGRISVKTALELIESTDNWEKILTVTGDTITLNSDAEQVLIGTKLQLIEENIDLALSQAQLQLAQIEGTEATLENAEADLITVEAQKTYDNAMLQSSAVSAGLGAAVGVLVQKLNALRNLDFDNSALNTSLFDAFNSAYDSVITLSTSTVDAAVTADELKQKISALQEQKNLISQINTPETFGAYYDFDKTPGDKYTDKSSTKSDSALEKLKKEYENKISLLENQKTYIENEISRLEASDQQVSRNLYEEQIKLEQQKLALYEKEREKLLAQMSTVAKNSDEWYEYADAIWEVEHSIQETAISVVELQKKIAQLYIDVFNKIDEAYSKEQSLHDKRIEALEDEIELLKLRNEYATISPETYNQLSAEEDAKIQSNQNEITRLKALLQKGIDENGEALTEEDIYDMLETIYEKEADIRQSEIKKEQYKQDKKQAYLDRFNNTSEAYDNLANVYQGNYDNAEYYKKYADLYGISIPKEILDYQTSQLEQQVQVTLNKKAELERQLAEAIASGDIQVGDSQWLEMVNAINDCTSAANEFQYQIAEVAQEINALSVEKFNDIKDAFSNVNDVFSDRQSYIEEYMNYLEALGITVPAEMYEELIANEEQRQASNMASLESLRSQLAEMEANGYTAEDDEWVQAQADIRALEKEVLASETAMAQWSKTIQEMSFEKFDEFLKRIQDVCDELENVYGLISDEDVALEDGSWTEEGIMSLGLMTQKMAIAKEQAAEYAKEIEKLEEEYQKGTMSEQDYYNRLMELKDGQWESINAYKDAKDAIIDINEARIDMIEQGIQKEIDAYTKLIDLKKKELDAERDLYNFRKDIKSQTKDIATLERKIAAMSGSTDAATIAQRSKLEAQLREARESLNDTYYDHAMDSQSNAYDDELDSYTKSKEDYVKQLREALKDVEKIVADSMAQVLVNADSVLTGLNNVSSEYGVTLSDYLMLPWQNAALQATAYKESGILDLADFTDQTGIYSGIITDQINNLFGNGSLAAGLFQTSVEGVVESIRVTVNEATSPLTSDLQLPWQTVKEYAQNTFAPEIMYALQSVADDASGKKEQLTNDLTIAFQEGVNNAEEFNQVVIDALNDVINKSDDFADVVPSNVTAPSDDPWSLWSSNVQNLIQRIIDKANDAVTAINSMNNAANNAQSIADTINSTGTSDNGGKGNSGSTKTSQPTSSYPPIGSQHTKYTEADVKALQSVLNSLFSTGLTVDGKLGPATSAAIKKAQRIMYQNGNETMKVQDGLYGVATRAAMISYIDKKIDNLRGQSGSSMMSQGIKRYTDMKKTLPKAFYAKGTMGISKDQWAITDEPQFGDELVLIPGASGNLSFMRKGTSVVPADITKRIFDLAQTPTNELGNNLVKVSIPNVSTNNNIELTFDTLLKVENATKETIPELKKLVQEQLDVFARKLNYGIKRVGQ
jgi:TP901 family phage tail tape measure protein